MLRKICIITLLIVLSFSTLTLAAPVATVEMTVLDKMVTVEKIIYGTEQTGALVERANRLEKDLYGLETNEALMTKVDRLSSYCKDNLPSRLSFVTKINAVEWTLTHMLTVQPVKMRIENLEQILQGNALQGSLDSRLTKLIKLAYANGQVDALPVTLPKDTLVKIKILTPLSSRSSRVGDIVSYQASEDVNVGSLLVLAKGAQGFGKVTKVEPAKNFGRNAELEVDFDTIGLMDGSIVSTFLGDKAKEEIKSLAKAAGASVAGMAILGPIGIVGGAFVHGDEAKLQAGSEMYIQIKNDTEANGILVK